MQESKKGSVIEKNSSKYVKFSLINDEVNNFQKMNTSHFSERGTKKKNKSNLSLFNVENKKNLKNSMGINLIHSNNNNFGFVSHFGKGMLKKNKNSSNNNLINCNTLNKDKNPEFSTNSMINNFNNNIDLNSSESSEQEKNLKHVEKEIKNRLIDMSTVIQDNKSFIMEHKWNHSDIVTIEEEQHIKKKIKKKKKKKKNIKKHKKEIEEPEKDRKMVKKKPLYDSLDEEEMQSDNDSPPLFINPEGRFIFVLDTIVLVSSFICFLYIPIQIASSKCFCIKEGIFFKIIMICIDFIYIIDFFVSFFRGFYNYEYKLIKDTKLILKKYLSGSFSISLIEAIPFNLLITYFCIYQEKYKPDGPMCFYNSINGLFSSIKVLSTFKIVKVLKAMNKRKNKAYEWIKEIDNHVFEKLYNLFSFTFLSFASMNVFICLHIFIAYQSYPNWILSMGIQDKPFIQIYIAALYGIIETLTTVGYGDVICDSFTEIIFQIILLSIGIVAYSFIITIIGNYVKNESKAEIKHSKDLTMLEEIRIEFPKMSFKLYNKIHQHLQSVSNQQKKIDLNILVNSLPYSVKNMVLFKVYNKCIKRFNVFKRCDNTDFISRVLTNFIPLFSLKKALLIREGEIIENIFFVKTGKLSLNVILDLDNEEDSIKSYLYEKFEDIAENENKQDKTNNNTSCLNKDSIINKNNPFDKVKSGIQSLFNQKRQTITQQSYHESRIEQEIGKCDLGGSDEEMEGKNFKFLRIMNINRNENFGATYMQLNKPSPLSLRVVSKKADLFILRRHDVINISKAYPSIWNKITENDLFNMQAIKKKTVNTLNNYCSSHGIVLDMNIPIKSHKLDPLNLFEIKELMELERMKQQEEEKINKEKSKSIKVKNNKKKSLSKKNRSSTHIIKQKEIISNVKKNLIKRYSTDSSKMPFLKTIIFNKKSCKFNNYKTIDLKVTEDIHNSNTYNFVSNSKNTLPNVLNKNEDKNKGVEENNQKDKLDKKEDSSFESEKPSFESENKASIKEKLELEDSNNDENCEKLNNPNKMDTTHKIYSNESEKSYPNTLSNFPPKFASFLKNKIIKKNRKNKKYYKFMCLKLIDTLNNIIKAISDKNNDNINLNNEIGKEMKLSNDLLINNYNSITYKNNNFLISNSNVIMEINKNNELLSSISNNEQSILFDIEKLSINRNDSFEIKAIYNNLNIVSSGTYEKNKNMQKETEEFVKFYHKKLKSTTLVKSSKTLKPPKIHKLHKKQTKESSFSELLGIISEIKSSNGKNSENNDINPIIENISKKKTLKKHSSMKSKNSPKKIKNVKFYKNDKESSKNRKLSTFSINHNNSSNVFESSDKKIINNQSKKKKGNKIFNYDRKKSKTFIKKIFKNNKNKKDNINKSQSGDYLNEISIFNPEIGLRTRNFEELKEKTLNKLQTDNNDKISIKPKINENKRNSSIEEEKINNNCFIF